MEQKLRGRGLERLVFFWQRASESGRRWWNRPGEGRRNEMAGGPWLFGSGRAKKTQGPPGGMAVSFQTKSERGAVAPFFKMVSGGWFERDEVLGLGFFFFFTSKCAKLPPSCVCYKDQYL